MSSSSSAHRPALAGTPSTTRQIDMLRELVKTRRASSEGRSGFLDNFGDPIEQSYLEHIIKVINADGIVLTAPLGQGYSKLVFATNCVRDSRPQVLRLVPVHYREHYANHNDVIKPNEVRTKDTFSYELADWMDFSALQSMVDHLNNRAERAGFDPDTLDIQSGNIGWTLRRDVIDDRDSRDGRNTGTCSADPPWKHKLGIGDGTPWPAPSQYCDINSLRIIVLYSVNHLQRDKLHGYALEERMGDKCTFAYATVGARAWMPGDLPEKLLYQTHHSLPLVLRREDSYLISHGMAEPELARLAERLDLLTLPQAPLPLADHFPSRPFFVTEASARGL